MQRFDPTTPDGRPYLTVDFTRLLPSAVLISNTPADNTVTIEVHQQSAIPDPGAASCLDGAYVLSADRKSMSQFFKNGIEDCDYVLKFKAKFSDTQVETVTVLLPVRRYI